MGLGTQIKTILDDFLDKIKIDPKINPKMYLKLFN